jgi:hypothetical protein
MLEPVVLATALDVDNRPPVTEQVVVVLAGSLNCGVGGTPCIVWEDERGGFVADCAKVELVAESPWCEKEDTGLVTF